MFETRVYYSDTDAGGVVYHSRYLDFCEKARTEFLRERGIIQSKLDFAFVVNYCNICYKKPARLDDLLVIVTEIKKITKIAIKMVQKVFLKDENKLLIEIEVGIVCVDKDFRLVRIPEWVLADLS